ncbi:hypothetical protein K469DRAFT_737305 [Zopfia rhizophila CBS 207.26]|uniref:BRCT domain-containing protein n=1 Tax=Zopfia rhizophila CBS 207.26 TaxID=1314779 RepID=A0A6A6EB85_9PEZI|nr:hypothetical protein K469DRAFT_737305 [Zopfia rhizophila CBS 207.26]
MHHYEHHATSQMPLAGAILCCTAIPPEQRTELAAIGTQMGALHKLDLTSDVTHLIVGSPDFDSAKGPVDINGAKYRYVAKSREDVKVVTPEWLHALRAIWMEGEDVDVTALERDYRVPTFHHLKICLTGFDDPRQRKYIQDTVSQNGAEYHGDLTKAVTHLIAATPSGKKYDHAINWRMKIVSWEWFQQSVERGMTLDEKFYHPTLPVEERGKGAWDRVQPISPGLGKRARDAEQNNSAVDPNPHRRKLRRSASSRMGSQSESLWAGITALAAEKKKIEVDDWTEDNFVKPDLPESNATESSGMAVMLDNDAQPAEEDTSDQPRKQRPQPSNRREGIFEGRVIFVHGFDEDKVNILRTHLTSNNAVVIRAANGLGNFSSDELKRGFLVISQDEPTDLTSLPEAAGELRLVSNWWVERCLHTKRLVDPTESVLCTPFKKLGISGFDGMIMSLTGFAGIELLHVTKAISLMGATYDENLTPKTSVLVCNTWKPNKEKLRFALDKEIPAVHSTWLWRCLETFELMDFEGYCLNKFAPQLQKPPREPNQSFTEVPTAPLSEEDSAKLRKKHAEKRDANHGPSKPKPKPRVGNQHSRTLDLTLSVYPMPESTTESTSTSNSTTDHQDPFTYSLDDPSSHPLQSIAPEVNSPRRPSTSSTHSATHPNTKSNSTSTSRSNSSAPAKHPPAPRKSPQLRDPTPDSVIPPPTVDVKEGKDYTSIMSDILARRKAAAEKPDKGNDKRRRKGKLGRATSTLSNPSTAGEAASRASSAQDQLNLTAEVDNEEDVDLVGGWGKDDLNALKEYEPSQSLFYEAPEVQEAREQMIRAMGGKVIDRGGVVGPIGRVKDVVGEGVGGEGIGGGVGRSGRRKRR